LVTGYAHVFILLSAVIRFIIRQKAATYTVGYTDILNRIKTVQLKRTRSTLVTRQTGDIPILSIANFGAPSVWRNNATTFETPKTHQSPKSRHCVSQNFT